MTTAVLTTCTTWPELSAGDRLYAEALAARGLTVIDAPWNGPFAPFADADAIVLRSNWDYHHAKEQFVDWLGAIEVGAALVFNPAPMVRWNLDKGYMLELGAKGVRIPRTLIVANEAAAIARAFVELGEERAVIKPAVGASGHHVYKVHAGNLDAVIGQVVGGVVHDRVIVQEFLPEIAGGELSMVFFDGAFSHALRRQPDVTRRLDHDPEEAEFRANGTHGVQTTLAHPHVEVIVQGRAALNHLMELPLYARVDGVVRDGTFILSELEVNEPGLRLELEPASAERFAEATVGRLSGGK